MGILRSHKALEILLTRHEFSPGERMNGTVILNLPNPKRARSVRVGIYCDTAHHHFHHGSQRRYIQRHIFHGERMYSDGEAFHFSFHLPTGLSVKRPHSIPGPDLSHAIADHKLKWYVEAILDIPIGFDLTSRLPIRMKRAAKA